MSQLIRSKLAAARRKHVLLAVGGAAAIGLTIALAMVGVTMLLDWWVELSRDLRALLLGVWLTLVAYVLVRRALVPIVFPPREDEVALWVERDVPSMNTRLIASVQLTRAGALEAGTSAALVRETVIQAERLAASMDFGGVVRTAPFVRSVGLLALLLTVFVAGTVRGGLVSIDLFKRAMLVGGVEVPRLTRVELVEPPQVVPRGEAVTVRARAVGVVPDSGTVEVRLARAGGSADAAVGAKAQRYRIERNGQSGDVFALRIENVRADFDYFVQLNDGRSGVRRVEVVDRPAATDIVIRQTYPAYTKLGEQQRAAGDLSVLAGSRLAVEIVTNKPVVPAVPGASGEHAPSYVRLRGAARDVALAAVKDEEGGSDQPAATGIAARRLRVVEPIEVLPELTGLSVHLTDELGLTTKDPTVHPLRVIVDRPPVVRITAPQQREELVTRRGRVDVGIEASDDIGIAKLALCYRVAADDATRASGARAPLHVIGLDVAPAGARSFRGRYPFSIERVAKDEPLAPGSTIEWWIEAEDANNITGPGRTESEHFLVRIVTDDEKRADLMSRLEGTVDEIGEIDQSQREASDKLGRVITETEAMNGKEAKP